MRPPSHSFIRSSLASLRLPLCPPPPFSSCDGLKLHSGDSPLLPLLASLAHRSPVLPDYSIFPQPSPAQPSPVLPFSTPLEREKKKIPNFTPKRWRAKAKSVASSARACVQACALDRHSGLRKNPGGGRSIPVHYSYSGNGGSGRSIPLSCRAARPNCSLRLGRLIVSALLGQNKTKQIKKVMIWFSSSLQSLLSWMIIRLRKLNGRGSFFFVLCFLFLRTDAPRRLMWKVMTCGCSNSQCTLTTLRLMGLAGLGNPIRTSSRLGPSPANGRRLYISSATDNFHRDHSGSLPHTLILRAAGDSLFFIFLGRRFLTQLTLHPAMA